MGLSGSHFLATPDNKHDIVVASVDPEVADPDFLDSMNAAGGQFMSLSDASTVLHILLNPRHPKSVPTGYSLNRWVQPVHDFEEDNWTQIGQIWGIIKARDSNNRLRKIYLKTGDVASYHSVTAFHPGTSYGVATLMTGSFNGAAKLAYDIFGIMQPAMDQALAELCVSLYAGQWSSIDRHSEASISVDRGTLYIECLILNGSDVLALFGTTGRVALRGTERRDELRYIEQVFAPFDVESPFCRLDIGIPEMNGQEHLGCMPYWNVQDDWEIRNGVPINLLYFMGEGDTRTLYYPSVVVFMKRFSE